MFFYNGTSFYQIWMNSPVKIIKLQKNTDAFKKALQLLMFQKPCRLIMEQNSKMV